MDIPRPSQARRRRIQRIGLEIGGVIAPHSGETKRQLLTERALLVLGAAVVNVDAAHGQRLADVMGRMLAMSQEGGSR